MSHPFTWVPAADERHASVDPAPAHAYPAGQEIARLCGREVIAEVGDYAWLWPTCADCDRRAREMVGAPALTEVTSRQAR